MCLSIGSVFGYDHLRGYLILDDIDRMGFLARGVDIFLRIY